MNRELVFETGRLQIKRFIHETAVGVPESYFCRIGPTKSAGSISTGAAGVVKFLSTWSTGVGLAASVRNAMLNPTVIS